VPGAAERSRSPVSLAAVIAVAALVLALGLNAAYTTWAVSNSQHRWCAVIDLLNAAPPPSGSPQKNPSRAYEQGLARDFRDLKGSLGCGS
jgi:hypothetical protein